MDSQTSRNPAPTGISDRKSGATDALVKVPAAAQEPGGKPSMWKRLAVLGSGRNAEHDERLELLSTRLGVIEEQLRERGIALERGGEVAKATASELTGRIANEMGRVERRLGSLEKVDGAKAIETALDGRMTNFEQRTTAQFDRLDERLSEVWEVEEQVAQLPEILDRLSDLREGQTQFQHTLEAHSSRLTWLAVFTGGTLLTALAALAFARTAGIL